jgi:uncharacterized C2H2 Zn-finger protein
MAQIIGYDQSVKSRFTCKGTSIDPGCGAIVEYTKSDIRKYHGTDYGGGTDGEVYVLCPGCNRKFILRSW